MGILFLIALVLAIPTFGLSIVGWFVLALVKNLGKAARSKRREEIASQLEPLFGDAFDDFFMSLGVPAMYGCQISQPDAYKCGRHIMNYIAHNPTELASFMMGLKNEDGTFNNPVSAADYEAMRGELGEVHLTSYRAIQALVLNNPSMKCFESVDVGKISLCLLKVEAGDRTGNCLYS